MAYKLCGSPVQRFTTLNVHAQHQRMNHDCANLSLLKNSKYKTQKTNYRKKTNYFTAYYTRMPHHTHLHKTLLHTQTNAYSDHTVPSFST